MFISNAEKSHIHFMIEQLQAQGRDDRAHFLEQISILKTENSELRHRLNQLQTKKIVSMIKEGEPQKNKFDLDILRNETKKAKMREYYHRKKAQRLESNLSAKAAQEAAPSATQGESVQ